MKFFYKRFVSFIQCRDRTILPFPVGVTLPLDGFDSFVFGCDHLPISFNFCRFFTPRSPADPRHDLDDDDDRQEQWNKMCFNEFHPFIIDSIITHPPKTVRASARLMNMIIVRSLISFFSNFIVPAGPQSQPVFSQYRNPLCPHRFCL